MLCGNFCQYKRTRKLGTQTLSLMQYKRDIYDMQQIKIFKEIQNREWQQELNIEQKLGKRC